MTITAMYDDSSIEIEGTVDGLRRLAEQIQGCGGLCHVHLINRSGRDYRGLHFAKAIDVQVNQELVNFTVIEGRVIISGSKDKLQILVQNVLFLADSPKSDSTNKVSDHIHIEYYPGGFPFLTKSALPLVVSRREM